MSFAAFVEKNERVCQLCKWFETHEFVEHDIQKELDKRADPKARVLPRGFVTLVRKYLATQDFPVTDASVYHHYERHVRKEP